MRSLKERNEKSEPFLSSWSFISPSFAGTTHSPPGNRFVYLPQSCVIHFLPSSTCPFGSSGPPMMSRLAEGRSSSTRWRVAP